ncbi:hypothetical protein GCK72_008914 [Caenorhabditis remanei]|uniref:X-box-binding protein 1 n=1 Tax=Caenorhabditis remanei TaxID=31234 RepID=A0A6A5H176_CAERE|nr:hypothetical protein GCK72_008914 [Caenorhabditis remanei]KAF1760665.1 hypothetical protein GCK72_008914 [Caenorhabditis remanei]
MSNYPKRIYVLPARQPRVIPKSYVAAPVQRPMKRPVPAEQIVAELLGDDLGPSGPRKRERLNHLTAEEKMDRRKMKNRVAAQNARDKKKERSGKIEEVVVDLVEENRLLRVENEKLRRQNEELLRQQSLMNNTVQIVNEPPMYINTVENNENLVTDSNIYSNVVYEEEVVEEVVGGGDEQCAFESAVFINAPLPWDKANRSSTNTANQPRRTDSNKKTTLDTYLTILSILCNHMDRDKTNTSTESSNTSRAHPESSIDSLLDTLRKEEMDLRRLLQADPSGHLQKRVKHFRRVP